MFVEGCEVLKAVIKAVDGFKNCSRIEQILIEVLIKWLIVWFSGDSAVKEDLIQKQPSCKKSVQPPRRPCEKRCEI